MSLKDQEIKAAKDIVESFWKRLFAIEQEILQINLSEDTLGYELISQAKEMIIEAEESLRKALALYPEICSHCGTRIINNKCRKCGTKVMPIA